jgi:hypothetical protein
LSKVYAAIRRFSEDIDLSFDRGAFALDGAVAEAKTPTQRERVLDQIDKRAKEYVATSLLPDLKTAMQAQLTDGGGHLTLDKGSSRHWDDLNFKYPLSLPPQQYGSADYTRPVVRMELVARGEHWPDRAGVVRAYAAQAFPRLFQNAETPVRALAAERTFWEKATLLHREYHVADSKPHKPGRSRHYADLAALAATPHGEEALRSLDLLTAVAEHKAVYFREPAARYDMAKPGTLRLSPPDATIEILRADYRRMAPMFFEAPPPFDSILQSLQRLEDRINAAR